MSRLAVALGFAGRQGLHNYKSYANEFSYVVRRAHLRTEAYYEQKPLSKDASITHVIRALKRLGWRG